MAADTHGIILVIISLIEAVFILWLFFTRSKGHILYSYLGFAVGVFFWVLGNGLHRLMDTNEAAFFWTDINHFFAMLIAVSFLYFSYAFPYFTSRINIRKIVILILPLVAFFILIFFTNTIVEKITGEFGSRFQVIGPLYHLYAVTWLFYFLWGLKNLFKKLKISDGVQRWQIKWLLVGIIISGIFGTFFDLFMTWFGGPQYYYLGSESSLIWLTFTGYVIFKKQV